MNVSGYAVVDLETSGFHPPNAEIVEFAVVHVDPAGQVTGSWDSLLRPERGVGATHVHGISASMVRDAPRFAAVAPSLHALLAGRVVVAHNLAFDGKFLVSQFGQAGIPAPEIMSGACTLRLAQRWLPGPPHKLADCCHHTGIPLTDAHAALGDATATAALLAHFLHRGVPVPGTPVRASGSSAAPAARPAAATLPTQRTPTTDPFLPRRTIGVG